MSQQKCQGCEANLDPDAMFCNECGLLQNTESLPHKEVAETKSCPRCSSEQNLSVKFCSKCAFNFEAGETGSIPPSESKPIVNSVIEKISEQSVIEDSTSHIGDPSSPSHVSEAVKTRYRDGYRVGNTIAGFGTLIKVLSILAGFIVGMIGFGLGAVLEKQARDASMGYVDASPMVITVIAIFGVIGFIIAAVGWVLGVIISAHGQMVKAALDHAVHSSPFLHDTDRAEVMSLKKKRSVAGTSKTQAVAAYDAGETNLKASAMYGLSFVLYWIWLPVPIFFLFTLPEEEKYLRFHSIQSIVLIVGGTILSISSSIFFNVIGIFPVSWIAVLIWISFAILQFFCIWKVYRNEECRIPFAGDIAEKFV